MAKSFNIEDFKPRFGYVIIEINFTYELDNNDNVAGIVIKDDGYNKHFLGKKVIVNEKPAEVFVINLTNKKYVIAPISRILATEIL